MTEPSCLLVVALGAEANPLRDHFKLKSTHSSPYKLWQKNGLSMVQTGLGKLNAASGTAWALGLLTEHRGTVNAIDQDIVCINIGICGAEKPIGTLICANEIQDQSIARSWFPPLTWQPPCETLKVITVDRPSSEYTETTAFDMEASGFIHTALKFSTAELIQSLKIVSDNSTQSFETIDTTIISSLISEQMTCLDQAIHSLIGVRPSEQGAEPINQLIKSIQERYRVSQTQGHQIKRLLQRHWALTKTLPTAQFVSEFKSTSELISQMESSVTKLRTRY